MNDTKILSRKEKWKIYKRSVKDIHVLEPWYLFWHCLINVVNAIQGFIPIYISAWVIDAIASKRPINETIILVSISMGVSFILQFPNNCLGKLLLAKENSLTNKGNMLLSKKILEMDFLRIENSETHRLYEKIKQLSNNYWSGFYNSIVSKTGYIAYGIACIVFSLIITWDMFSNTGNIKFSRFLGIVIIALIIITLVIENIIHSKMLKKENAIHSDDDFVDRNRFSSYFSNNYCGTYQATKEIHIYNQKGFIVKSLYKMFQRQFVEYKKIEKLNTKYEIFQRTLGLARSIMIYSFVAFRAMAGAISAGGIIKDVQGYFRLQSGIEWIVTNIAYIDAQLFPMKQMYEFLDIPEEKYKGTIPVEKRDDNQYEFEFKNVSFKYPAADSYSLMEVNLKWRIGEKMALVGKNGSGKSTLVKLLCRLYDPTDGVITLNGIDIKKYDYDEYMELFSVVFQDSNLFSFSIAENVAASSDYDKELVSECCKRAGMWERVSQMEYGIRTCLYKDFDKDGIEISGGEAQKLTLARAVYKGAPFVILDEPTAALDPIAENEIYTHFNTIVGTRTAIYISHRLSSCRFCDDITVLDNGRVVEQGSHEVLVSKGGAYSKLWIAQAEYYKDTAGELFI